MPGLYLGMAYRKRLPTAHTCVHCHEGYQAVDRRRLYCSSSCKVQACKAKRRRRLAAQTAKPALAPRLGKLSLAGLTLPKPPPVTLAWSTANVALFTTASLAAQLLLRVGDKLHKSLTTPAAQLPRVDPVSWLPAAFVTHLPKRKLLAHPLWGPALGCIELRYFGHTFFYQPVERCLLWEMEPGLYSVVTTAEQVPLIAELDPYQAPQLGYGYQPDPLQLSPAPRPGSMLKDLG